MTKITKRSLITFGRLYAEEHGLINLSRADVCRPVGIPVGSFRHVAGCTWREFIEELSTTKQPKRIRHLYRSRTDPTLMKEFILDRALDLAEQRGYDKITRADIAETAGVSPSLITYHFGTMDRLHGLTLLRAIKEKRIKVVAQGLANDDANARRSSRTLRRRAAKLLSGV